MRLPVALPVNSPEKHVKKELVWIYMPTRIFVGYVYHLHRQRLLDVLNGVSVGGLHTNGELLPVSEVVLDYPGGKEVAMGFALVNKANILFVRKAEHDLTRQSSKANGHKLYPVVDKIPVAVKLHMPCYPLIGQMHCAKGQWPSDLLNMRERFLALTNVEILPATGTSESGISFLAVNKEQIIYVEQG